MRVRCEFYVVAVARARTHADDNERVLHNLVSHYHNTLNMLEDVSGD